MGIYEDLDNNARLLKQNKKEKSGICPNCGNTSFWFDRIILPPCDSMHLVCENCDTVKACGHPACYFKKKKQPNNIQQNLVIMTLLISRFFRY